MQGECVRAWDPSQHSMRQRNECCHFFEGFHKMGVGRQQTETDSIAARTPSLGATERVF